MIPAEVMEACSQAETSGLPPTVQAANFELRSGAPTLQTAALCSLYWASGEGDDKTSKALGGVPGYWWAASVVPSLPGHWRNTEVDTWSCAALAQAHPDIVANASGSLRPKVLQVWDERSTDADARLRELVQMILDSVIADSLARGGLDVLAAVRDPAVKDRLRTVEMVDVLAVAHNTEVRPGRTLAQAAKVDVAALTTKAVEQAKRSVLDVLRKAEARIMRDVNEVFGVRVSLAGQKQRFGRALDRMEVHLRNVLAQRLGNPNDPAPELGERASGHSPGQVAFEVIAIAAGARSVTEPEIDTPTGLVVSAAGIPFAGTLSSRPELMAAITRALRTDGEPQTVIAVLTDAASEAAPLFAEGAVVQQITTWRHGSPSVPFPPHRDLDGAVVGTEEFEERATAGYQYLKKSTEEIKTTEPFRLGRWFPGDHAGCTCSWDTETIVGFGDAGGLSQGGPEATYSAVAAGLLDDATSNEQEALGLWLERDSGGSSIFATVGAALLGAHLAAYLLDLDGEEATEVEGVEVDRYEERWPGLAEQFRRFLEGLPILLPS